LQYGEIGILLMVVVIKINRKIGVPSIHGFDVPPVVESAIRYKCGEV